MKSLKKATNKGFTLIELLVVVAVIGLISSVVLVAAQAGRARGRDGKRLGDMSQMSKALELYFNDNYGYPTATDSLGAYQVGGVLLSTTIKGLVPKYLSRLPDAPPTPDGSCTNTNTPILNNLYWYQSDISSNKASRYTIAFCLGFGQQGVNLGPGTHYLVNGALR